MTLSIKSERLNYTDNGNGENLCLLHGFLENKEIWDPFLTKLTEHYRVISIDLPGHGESSLLAAGNTMVDMAHAVHSVLRECGIAKVKFIGHSMGGYVALAYAETFPQEVMGVLLMNSTPEADTLKRKELRKHGIKVAKTNYEALISMSVVNLFTQKFRANLEEEIQRTKSTALATSQQSYIACQGAMALRADYSNLFKQALFKKKIVLGAQDTLLDSSHLTRKFSNQDVEVVILDGGHMLHLENPNDLMKHLIQF
ncbi:alpha/beta fold hydrolase [Leeuwenhoekiella sp. MAR_2009_132]|uniref:alpha/beta fold hydrolase n=1 Tax=Leeuwenhoekiella sp. MAR_2009_132 TaxID=1392489 RepID=UPI00048D0A00|nr:alpha/beta hydrolase [Leeuwenhoekiella sp. MAR_2009_132]